ncbi:MAG: SEC-C metal-binding domain-containing protein [bacterium]
MNTKDGTIHLESELKRIGIQVEDWPDGFFGMTLPPTKLQLSRRPPRVGLDESCPCGSGKTFKDCHFSG